MEFSIYPCKFWEVEMGLILEASQGIRSYDKLTYMEQRGSRKRFLVMYDPHFGLHWVG